ncbi:MAG: hypothetical protein L3J71_08890 [Victivallaceae bacterium]|nr:hypothetical protein [Victivallaceae bacterium]
MTYAPNKHHRRSIRRQGYDYARTGAYFITICAENHHHLFGAIKNGIMNLNDKRIWQRNYWDHIIRNANEYSQTSHYIIKKPQKWQGDKLNGGDGNIVMESQSSYGTEAWIV